MAEVFRAVMPGVEGFQRSFVVKRILSERARTADFVDMFVQEARICALLHHPNIVQVFDFGNVEGSYFLAMELLRGRDVAGVLRRLREFRRPMPAPIAAFIAQQVALGLGYAHALRTPDGMPINIVHRDVSPSNIMCLRTGGVKLLDFGIAKALGDVGPDPDRTEQGMFKGKLAYMAPERLRQDPQDGRVDIFALGAVLWEMLVGKRLFQGKTEIDTLKNVLELPVPPPSALRDDVPTSLDYIVVRALERNPEQRYLSGQAMADDLEQVLQETRYQSRMLPLLIEELFGTGSITSQLALSKITPELLSEASAEAEPSAPQARGWRSQVRSLVQEPTRRRRRLMLGAAAAAGLAGICAAGALLIGGADRGRGAAHAPSAAVSAAQPSARPPAPETPRTAAPVAEPTGATPSAPATVQAARPAPEAPRAAAAVVSPGPSTAPRPAGAIEPPAAAEGASDLAGEAGSSGRARRPSSRARRSVESDRITRGLSIDPFAEAGLRGGRP